MPTPGINSYTKEVSLLIITENMCIVTDIKPLNWPAKTDLIWSFSELVYQTDLEVGECLSFKRKEKRHHKKKIKTRAKTKSGKKLLAPMVQGPKELAKEPSFQICDQHMITPLLEIPPCLLMKFRGNLLRKTEQNCLSNHSSWGRLWVVCVGVWNKKLERKREQLSVRNILDTTLTKPHSFNQNLCSCDPYLW